MHGVLLDVFGVGILLLGKSGIGKSEIALDLVMRGHRLVADDIVDVKRRSPDAVQGAGSEIIKHHMEIRGLGIINIKDLFGVAVDPRAEEDRDRARARGVGPERRVRPARRRGEEVPDPRRRDPDAHRAGAAGPQHDDHRRGGGAQPPAEAPGPPLRRASSRSGSTAPSRSRRVRASARWTSSDAARRDHERSAGRHPHRRVRVGEVDRPARARGRRVLLRRQPPHPLPREAARALRAHGGRGLAHRPRRRRARGPVPRGRAARHPGGPAEGERRPGPLPRRVGRLARPSLLRDAPPPPALGRRRVGPGRDRRRAPRPRGSRRRSPTR